jgi:autotransporter-associated beta strand protein
LASRVLITAVAILLGGVRAHAQTVRTWNVTSGTWSATGSWDGGVAPTATDTAYFSSSTVGSSAVSVTFSTFPSIAGLSFNNSGSTSLKSVGTGRTITLGTGGITVASSAGPVSLGGASSEALSVLLNGTQTWTNDSSSLLNVVNGINTVSSDATLTIAGSGSTKLGSVVSGSTGRRIAIVKQGAGVLMLTANNTYSGGFTLSEGTLMFDFSSTSQLGTGTFTILGGAIDSNLANLTRTLAATPQAWNGDFAFLGSTVGGNLNMGTGTVTLGGTRTVTNDSGNILTVGGGINDGGNGYGLTKSGTGRLILTGSSSYTGPTTISAGRLQIGSSGTIGSIAASSTVSIASGAVLAFSRTDDYGGAFANRITGAGSLSLVSGGTLTLSNPSNDFSGGITFPLGGGAAVLQVNTPGALGTGPLTNSGSGTLRFQTTGTIANTLGTDLFYTGVLDTQSNAITLSGSTTGGGTFRKVGSGTLTLAGTTNTPDFNIAAGMLRLDEAGQLGTSGTYTGAISGSSGAIFEYASSANTAWTSQTALAGGIVFRKMGSGTVSLLGYNISGTANVELSEGTIVLGQGYAMPTGTLTINGGSLDVTTNLGNVANNAQVWNGDFAFLGTNTLNLGTGTVSLGGNRTVTVSGSSLTVGGPIGDGGSGYGLTKSGPGTLVLSGSSSYSGPTTVTGGTLTVSNTFALGSGTAALNVNGGVLSITSTIGFSRSGPITLAGGTIASGTFTNTGSALDARSGAISSVLAGTLGLAKTTSGTVALSGANTFSGGVALSAGQLNLNAAGALGTGTFTITGGVLGNSAASSVSTNTANAHRWNSDFSFAGPSALTLGSGTVTLGATRTVTVTSSTLTVGIPITGAAGFGLTKAGPGTLVLSGSNGYTGPTTVNEGVLTISGTNTGAGQTAVNGGRLNLVAPAGLYNGNTASWTKENITVGSGGVLSVRTGTGNFTTANVTTLLTNLGGLGGAVNNNGLLAGSAIGFDTTLGTGTVANVIADSTGPGGGAIGLVKYGANTLLLTGSSTYTGTTSITAGTLRIGTTGRIAGPIANAAALLISHTSVSLPGQITGTGALTTSGTGTVTLSNASSVFDGPVTIPGGALESASLGGSGVVNLGSGTRAGTLRFTGASQSTTLAMSLSGSGGTLDASGSGPVSFTGGVTGAAGTTLTLTGSNTGANSITAISGSNVTKTGVGTWVFGTNSFTGRLSIEQGTIIASGNAPGGSGTSSSLGKENGPIPVVGLANATGTAALLAANGVTISRVIEVAALGSGSQEVVLGGSGAGEATFDGNSALRLGRGVTLAADPGGNVRFLTPTANWDKQDSSTDPAVPITIGTPTATGTVTLETTLPGSITAVTVRQGTLRLGNGTTVGALGPTSVLTGSAGATLAFDRSDTITSGVHFANSIGGAMNVRQQGSGTVALGGVNTYTGATDVVAGTLAVDGVLGNTAVTVALGATLSGTGTIGGPTTILGTHAPGSSPGIETFTSGLTYGATSTLVWELIANTDSPASRGVLFDGVDLTGGALSILSGATLSLVFDLPGSTVDWDDAFWGTNRSWTVIDVAGGTWNSSLFTLQVGDDSTTASLTSKRPDASFQIVDLGGDLVLEYVIVPEPGTLALTAIGLAAAAWGYRRRGRERSRVG